MLLVSLLYMKDMNKIEKLEFENLVKIMRRAKFDNFSGLEALAFARAYAFLNDKLEHILKLENEEKTKQLVLRGTVVEPKPEEAPSQDCANNSNELPSSQSTQENPKVKRRVKKDVNA